MAPNAKPPSRPPGSADAVMRSGSVTLDHTEDLLSHVDLQRRPHSARTRASTATGGGTCPATGPVRRPHGPDPRPRCRRRARGRPSRRPRGTKPPGGPVAARSDRRRCGRGLSPLWRCPGPPPTALSPVSESAPEAEPLAATRSDSGSAPTAPGSVSPVNRGPGGSEAEGSRRDEDTEAIGEQETQRPVASGDWRSLAAPGVD